MTARQSVNRSRTKVLCLSFPAAAPGSIRAYCPERLYRQRHKIENYFCRIKDWRRIATRYDKLARNVLAATVLVGALY
jgi:transposase